MPYTPKNWEDAPSTNTPINAAALEDLESRVTDYTDDEVATRAAASHDHVAADVTDFDTQVRTSRLDQMAAPTAEVGMNGQQLGGLPASPVDDDHAAPKGWVDAALAFVAGLKVNVGTMNAKGDIYAATANDTPDRLGVGANDTVLMGASGEATGLKYDKVKAANVDATLKPSGSAAVGDESLRALGLTSGTAARGDSFSSLLGVPVLLGQQEGNIQAGAAAANYGFASSGNSFVSGATHGSANYIPIIAADFPSITGKNLRFFTRLVVNTNATAPAITFTGGLSRITASAGGANVVNVTFGAQTAGTTAAVASPAASTAGTWTDSADFAVPTDGQYLLTVTTSGGMAATNPKVNVMMYLYWYYV